MHEPEAVLAGARLALPRPDSPFPAGARNVARWTVGPEGRSPGAVAIGRGTKRTETEPAPDQFVDLDLLGVDIEYPQLRRWRQEWSLRNDRWRRR
ncbi:hypothetical protein [Rhodococcoides yunnanense]|uniref:hypothetical protein n=1 Tax=Rhodococcoides yunnanense TaxID=278209 RepID=UPI0035301128